MEHKEYNGWTNYETWLVNLWLNESGEDLTARTAEYVQAAIDDGACDAQSVRDAAAEVLAQTLENDHDDAADELNIPNGVFSDLLSAALREVDWRSIADHYVSDVQLWSAGWNLPGCLPDSDPAVFTDAASALAYIVESAVESLDPSDEGEGAGRDKLADDIEAWKADSKGEFGQTVGAYHYWVAAL